ncbi:MAG: DUF4065 domain-containing protein [Oscillospiraceae bacterium]|nr:DUF4065 domain-containing protein [Oscillospiraceae bacterium]
MYTAVELSKYIVSKCFTENHPISNLQLQKILYYIQKEYLKNDSRAFADEIEAWQFGPVVPNSYYHFCAFGAMPITSSYDSADISANDKLLINPIVVEKRQMDPWQLVDDTHKPGGAWAQVYNNGLGSHTVIPVDLIKSEE